VSGRAGSKRGGSERGASDLAEGPIGADRALWEQDKLPNSWPSIRVLTRESRYDGLVERFTMASDH
jgi:hypothetical protein